MSHQHKGGRELSLCRVCYAFEAAMGLGFKERRNAMLILLIKKSTEGIKDGVLRRKRRIDVVLVLAIKRILKGLGRKGV